MPYRRPARRRRGGSTRRKLVWATVQVLNTSLAATNDWVNIDLLDQLRQMGSSVLGCTIMRTHLRLDIYTAPTASDTLTLGLLVGRKDDVGANTGISPITQDMADWMLYYPMSATPAPGSTAAFSQYGTQTIEIDNRSKRKVAELDQYYLFSLGVNSTAATVTFNLNGRVLVALP